MLKATNSYKNAQRMKKLSILGVSVFTLVALGAYGLKQTFLNAPVWIQAKSLVLQPTQYDEPSQVITPIYYLILNFPKTFANQPIPYQLSYHKGPPNHFVAQIQAQLNPQIHLTYFGPKTPEPVVNRSQLKSCLTHEFELKCFKVRSQVLSPWLNSLSSAGRDSQANYDLDWFEIVDPVLAEEDQTQGFHLQFHQDHALKDIWVLVNSTGTQQAIRLTRDDSKLGQVAYELVSKSIASARMYSDLKYGRELINQNLSQVRLEAVKSESNPNEFQKRLSDAQILLISKVSVDPASLEAYFHLAGTSTWLIQRGVNDTGLRSQAQENLKASYLYARDIAPLDPKTTQIQDFWLTY